MKEGKQAERILYASIYIIVGNANEIVVTESRFGCLGTGGGEQEPGISEGAGTKKLGGGDDGYAHYLEHTYVKTHRMVHFKYVQFIVCQLSVNEVKGKGICEEVKKQ